MNKIILTLIIALLCIYLPACNSAEDELDASMVGPTDIVTGGSMLFKSKLDTQLTTSCGTATAQTTASAASATSTTTESSSSSGSKKEEVSKYTISSYLQFGDSLTTAQTMLLKFTYDEEQDRFRMIPSSSTAQTCPTTDFISCNGSTGVNPTCETTDNISCGGADSFIFTSTFPSATFEASSGTIDWQNGFTIDTASGQVELLDLDFDMISKTGASINGSVRCRNN